MRLIPASIQREPIALQDVVAATLTVLCIAGLGSTLIHLSGEWREANARLAAERAVLAAPGDALTRGLADLPIDAASARAALDQVEARIQALAGAHRNAEAELARGQAVEAEKRGELAAIQQQAIEKGLEPLPDHTFDPGPEPGLDSVLTADYWTWSSRKRLCDMLNPLIRLVDGLALQNQAVRQACQRLGKELDSTRAARAQMIEDMAHAVEIARDLSRRSAEAVREAEAAALRIDGQRIEAARQAIRASPWTRFALIALHLPVALYFLVLGLRFAMRLAVLRRWLKPRRIAV